MHPLPSLFKMGNNTASDSLPVKGKPYLSHQYWFNQAGYLDSAYIYSPDTVAEKRYTFYDSQMRPVRYVVQLTNGKILQDTYMDPLPQAGWRYRTYSNGGLFRESYMREDSVISYSKTYSGDRTVIYEYDFEKEIATTTSSNDRWLTHQFRYEWKIGGEEPDSMIYTFSQYAPGKSRMPSHQYHIPINEDGRLEILPVHQHRSMWKDKTLETRMARFKGIDRFHFTDFIPGDLPEKSGVSESPDYEGWVHRHYLSYSYVFW